MLAALLTNLPAAVEPPIEPPLEVPSGGGGWIRPKKARRLKPKIDPQEKTELFEGTGEPAPWDFTIRGQKQRLTTVAQPRIKPALRSRISRHLLESRIADIRRRRRVGEITESEEEEALMIILLSL